MLETSVGDPRHFGKDPDPQSTVMGPDPDPTPDPTPFFSYFKDAKKKFPIFFLITYPQAHYLLSENFYIFWQKICVKIIQFASIISQSAQRLYEKGKDPEPEPDPESDL
jgi:hypothetical protein